MYDPVHEVYDPVHEVYDPVHEVYDPVHEVYDPVHEVDANKFYKLKVTSVSLSKHPLIHKSQQLLHT